MVARVLHPYKLALFFSLSVADLVLTWWLIVQTGNEIYESNPVAAWWLTRYGWAGLAIFKALAVLMVTALAVLISLSQPRVGGRVLGFGCAAVGAVVCYSVFLIWSLDRMAGVHPRAAVVRVAYDRLPPPSRFSSAD
jgi:hypothetical protein